MAGSRVDTLVAGVLEGDRARLARAITLVESRSEADRADAAALLSALAPRAGGAHRIGVSGVPGVGKSTLIEALGRLLVARGQRVGVLAVDPSSALSGGSILGDKARMPRLAQEERAFIRPSPTALSLGGVARRTRESMLVLEAAGHDVILVETVGVGQSETVVADMVDTFLVLLLPGGGDELQAIKKGILERADLVAVNKAEGERLPLAREAARAVSTMLRTTRRSRGAWQPRTLLVSARTGAGLEELREALDEHRRTLADAGELEARRHAQVAAWLDALCEEGLVDRLRSDPRVAARREELLRALAEGSTTPAAAAAELLASFLERPDAPGA